MKEQQPLIGESPAILAVMEHVSKVAPLAKPVLVIGERGTGKELIAERLHFLSRRWDQPFIKLNCAALAESLLETELFGHESGAFTGASRRHKGRFELADGGSLFLDELANSSTRIQEKLLRVIEYGEFERVGGAQSITTDVRVIAATNQDLPALAARNEFRADLLDRLAFDVITLPPLRHRQADILPLAEHFAQRMVAELGEQLFAGFSRTAATELQEYAWPGNVRELKSVVERAVYRNEDPEEAVSVIQFDPFESPYRPETAGIAAETSPTPDANSTLLPGQEVDFKETVSDFEVQLLKQALESTRFNQRKAAELLNLTYHQMRGLLRKYQLLDEGQKTTE